MYKCFITGNEGERGFTKTEDGFDCLTPVYNKIRNMLRKSLLTKEDIQIGHTKLKKLDFLTNKLLANVKYTSIFLKIDTNRLLTQVLEREEKMCNDMFKKSYKTIDIEEHIKVIELLTELYKVKDKTTLQTRIQDLHLEMLAPRYLLDRAYIQRLEI